MTTLKAILLGLGGLLVLAAGAFAVHEASSKRADCPGMIVCPIDGETICKDQCPLLDPNRPDCPGKIVCPLTGGLVCKDECPVGDEAPECCKPATECCKPAADCCSTENATKD